MSGKRLLPDGDEAVDEALEGLILSHSSSHGGGDREQKRILTTLPGHPRVVAYLTTSPGESVSNPRVAVVSGGGSGHEPFAAGFVGEGMLDAAVCGRVFASPPVEDVEAALGALIQDPCYSKGILVVVLNYTGDRLNFGLAVQRLSARNGKVPIEMVVVGDEAVIGDPKEGRGLAGAVLAIKVAGAMARAGNHSLSEISSFLRSRVLGQGRLASIGLGLSGCCPPGSTTTAGPVIEPDQMVLGLGIHGESGIRKVKLTSAKEAARTILDHLMLSLLSRPKMTTAISSYAEGCGHHNRMVVLVNNLGSMTSLDLSLVAGKVIRLLVEEHDVTVARIYVGSFMTSLDTNGFSVTLLKLDKDQDSLLAYLDEAAEAPGWHNGAFGLSRMQLSRLPVVTLAAAAADPIAHETLQEGSEEGPQRTFESEACAKAIEFSCAALISCEGMLNLMDSVGGDGDCGTTLRLGAQELLGAISTRIESGCNEKCSRSFRIHSAQEAFKAASRAASKGMGGSSGALFGLFFEAAAATLADCPSSGPGASHGGIRLALALHAGLDAIKDVGGAAEGDRTLIDSLSPALKVLDSGIDALSTPAALPLDFSAWLELLEKATSEAEKGATSTLGMKAKAGRASYVDHNELKYPDPGAHAVGIIFRAVHEALKIKAREHGLV